MPTLREDDRLERHPRLRPDRARPAAEAGVDVREGVRADAGGAPSEADHRRVPHRASGPRGRVLVDYNQNAWGRTLASVYSVAPDAAGAASRRR